ncbi:MAG: S1C family serine protease, partial [Pseudohongiellaceae bacterium]
MQKILETLKLFGWPVICGLLAAFLFLQNQQLQQAADQLAAISLERTDSSPPGFAEVIARAAPSVVSISATSVNIESVERAADDQLNLYLGERASLGSGIIVSEQGFILTNLHVVDTLFDAFDTEVTLHDGRRTPATVIAYDSENDLAVLHINMDDLTPISVGKNSNLKVGNVVFAIGYPRRNIGQSVSQGIVSAISSEPDGSQGFIQTDAAINPGNSGGALIDREGRLVGINTSIFSESGSFEGIGFATPAHIAINAMNEMVAEAIAQNSGYLGVITGEALTAQSSQLFFGVDSIRGMLVESVDPGGAAERAGIMPGDVITRVGNTPVSSGQNIMLEIRNAKPGETLMIEIFREGQLFELPTILGF